MGAFENATSWTEWLVISDNMTDNLMIPVFVFSCFCVLFMASMHYGKWRALTYSSFVTLVLIVMLNLAGLIDYYYLILAGFFLAIGMGMTIQSKRGD